MKVMVEGTKSEIHDWQFDLNNYYRGKYKEYPPLVKSPSGY